MGQGLGPGPGQNHSQSNALFKDKSDRENHVHVLASAIGGLHRLVDLKLKDNRGGGDIPRDLVEAVMSVCPGLRNGWTTSATASNNSSNNNNSRSMFLTDP